MGHSLGDERANFGPRAIASHHYIKPRCLWFVLGYERIGSVSCFSGFFDSVSPFFGFVRDGIEEKSTVLTAVDFGTRALAWTEAWASGAGVVRGARGFAFRAEELREFGCEMCSLATPDSFCKSSESPNLGETVQKCLPCS